MNRPRLRRHYILKGHEPVLCEDAVDWAMWAFGPEQQRHVADEEIEGIRISTVFLGMDHNFRGEGPPVLFETMTFADGGCAVMARYRTWDEAEAGHAQVRQLLREELQQAGDRAAGVLSALAQRVRGN
jgi:hypothetical protein